MKETDTVTLQWELTVLQLRRLRRKLHEMSRGSLSLAKRDKNVTSYDLSAHFAEYILWDALATDIEEKLKSYG